MSSLPIVYAHQAPPHGSCGGYFETDAGFIIVKDYDETKEPWWIAGRSRRQL